jgi:uncharacterized membrane protein YidH (DUF202 family)
VSVPAGRDPGLQQERTMLAWRRTGLALLVGSLTIGRLTLEVIGPVVVVPTVLTATLAGWVVVESLRSRRLARAHPHEPGFSVLSDGRLPAAVAAVLAGLAAAEVAAAVVRLL